jgi:hypothetical protein
MKRVSGISIGLVAIMLLAAVAQAGFTLGLINISKETKTTGQLFETESKSTGNIGGAGHQLANLPNIGQGLDANGEPREMTGADGLPINLAGFQTQYQSEATNTASLESAIDLIRANQSDVTRAGGDATQSDTGDKNRAGPSTNTAVTGQGVSNASQKQPNAQGQPTNTESNPVTVQVNKAELEEFQAQALANKAALDAAKATEARLRPENAAAQEDMQKLAARNSDLQNMLKPSTQGE